MSRIRGVLSWGGWVLAIVLLFRDIDNFYHWEARNSKTDVTGKTPLQGSHSDNYAVRRQQHMDGGGRVDASTRDGAHADELVSDGISLQEDVENTAARHDADVDELVSDGNSRQENADGQANETLVSLDRQEGSPGRGNTTAEKRSSSPGEATDRLHFYVLGFPKCGTTTLLKAFHGHNETGVPQKEICSLGNGGVSNDERLNDLNKEFISYEAAPGTKLGIKCPHHFSSPVALKTIAANFSDVKLVIGLRHPVLFFQSFYNYRVNDVREGRRTGRIPPPEELIGLNKWQDVYTDLARYELNLRHVLFHVPKNSFFLYISDQLGDPDEDRASRFRETFRRYLGLRTPLPPFPFGNVNEQAKGRKYEEHINICDPEHDTLRSHIVYHGNATAQWMRDVFLQRHSVHVGEPKHFLELMDGWSKDPC